MTEYLGYLGYRTIYSAFALKSRGAPARARGRGGAPPACTPWPTRVHISTRGSQRSLTAVDGTRSCTEADFVPRLALAMGSVDRLLYRQLLRQGRAHDRIPAFKALLANQRTRVYSREESRWTELEHCSELAAEELRSHAKHLFGCGTNCVRTPSHQSQVLSTVHAASQVHFSYPRGLH